MSAVVSVTDNAPGFEGEVDVDPGPRLVAFEIALFNSGTTVFAESPFYFLSLVDTNAQWYSTSFIDTTLGAAFPDNVALQPGAQLIGYVTFEVPVGEQPLKLQAALDSGLADQMAELHSPERRVVWVASLPMSDDNIPFDEGSDDTDRVAEARRRLGRGGAMLAAGMLGLEKVLNDKPKQEAPIVIASTAIPSTSMPTASGCE